jgi:hypothetical protein
MEAAEAACPGQIFSTQLIKKSLPIIHLEGW